MRKATGHGYIFEASGSWHTRFTIGVKGKRIQQSVRVCTKDTDHDTKESVVTLATEVVKQAQTLASNREQTRDKGQCPTCGRFTRGVTVNA